MPAVCSTVADSKYARWTCDSFATAKDIKYGLMYQPTRITRDRGALAHDDRLDALAMAVAFWVGQMIRDNDKAAASSKGAAINSALK